MGRLVTIDRALEVAEASLHEERRKEAHIDQVHAQLYSGGPSPRTAELSEALEVIGRLRESPLLAPAVTL